MPRAASRIACEAGASGSSSTSGAAVVGVLAKRLRERDLAEQRHVELVGQQLAAALAEDREALAVGAVKADMFSITPDHLEVDLGGHLGGAAATLWAAGCGVVTIRILAWGRSWASVIETSPVPGGRSSSR